jgi:hypothetical protein
MTENIEQKTAHLTIEEARQEFANMSPQWYWQKLKSGDLKSKGGGKKGAVHLISRESLEQYFKGDNGNG